MARSAPISAQPRAASMPMPMGPEAPVTTTTLPLRLKSSWMESAAGTLMGMVTVLVGSRLCKSIKGLRVLIGFVMVQLGSGMSSKEVRRRRARRVGRREGFMD